MVMDNKDYKPIMNTADAEIDGHAFDTTNAVYLPSKNKG